MTDNIKTGGRGFRPLTVLIGAVVVAVVVVGFFFMGGEPDMSEVDMNAQAPQAEQPAMPEATGSTESTGETAPGGTQ